MENEDKKQQRKEYLKTYYQENKDKFRNKNKEYYQENKDKMIEYQKEYQKENNKKYDRPKDYNKEYYKKNKDKIIKQNKEYVNNNKLKINEYNRNRRLIDPLFKLKTDTTNNIRKSLHSFGFDKLTKTEIILGCTFIEFKTYLESKFETWMNWENKGNWNGNPTEINTAWDIDHIIPTSSATTELELLKLNHYSNLQPLCSYTNRYIKKDKI